MRIPKKINVLGKEWKVSYKWNLMLDDMHCDGMVDYTCRTIFLDRSVDKVDRPQTFMHELLHAIIYEAKLRHAESFSPEIEEVLVENISSYLIDTFAMRLKSKKR